MKLWHSFIKELKLTSKSFYFYIEIAMAVIFLVILLAVMPENFESKQSEYLYLNTNTETKELLIASFLSEDEDKTAVETIISSKGEEYKVTLYESSSRKIYLTDSKEDLISLSKNEKNLGAVITLKEDNLFYDYYLQGYESDKYKNLLSALHSSNLENANSQVKTIGVKVNELSDRANSLPVFLYINGSLMGLFIIASYIFLDKSEGIIKAYAITASKLWNYLASKVGVIIVTSVITSLILVIPVMGVQPNYLAFLILLITTGFFTSVVGLILASYYTNIMQSFGVLYLLIIGLSIPAIGYYIPSWSPVWLKFIPTYPMVQGFKEVLIPNGDIGYVLTASLAYLIVSLLLFGFANYRFKKTLEM